jgi:hypothetical protein
MFDKIATELSRLIAKDIYDAAKKISKATVTSLKSAGLKVNGAGLPPDLAKLFYRAFENAIIITDGTTKYAEGGEEFTFSFRLVSSVIRDVQKSCKGRWAQEAKTQIGIDLIQAFGGEKQFEAELNNLLPQLVESTITAYVGQYFPGLKSSSGRRILTPVLIVGVSHRGKKNFTPNKIVYLASGSEKETKEADKLAKKFLVPGFWRRLLSPMPVPSDGPYFRDF